MSTSGDVAKALQRGIGINCEVVQIFVKNNMQWFGKPYSQTDLAEYANELSTNKLACHFLSCIRERISVRVKSPD